MSKFYVTLVTFFLFFFTTQDLFAQGYIRGGAGIGIGTVQDAFAIPAIQRDSSNTIISQSVVFGTFGSGARFSLAGGYMITDYFGVELEIYYMQGFRQAYGSDLSPTNDTYERKGYTYQLRATPSLVVQAPDGKFQPYARFGVLIPFFGQTILEEESYNAATGQSKSRQLNVNGKFSLGFESSIGLQYNFNENLGIYLHATYTGLRIRSDRAEVKKDLTTKSDGTVVDNLENASTISKFTEFQDVMTQESNFSPLLAAFAPVPEEMVIKIEGTLDFDKPLNLPTQTSNFNAITLSLGVKYTFN